jgi:hypothetical protein
MYMFNQNQEKRILFYHLHISKPFTKIDLDNVLSHYKARYKSKKKAFGLHFA